MNKKKKKIENTIKKLKNDKLEEYFIRRSGKNETLEQILEILKYFDPINFYYDSNIIPKSSLIIKSITLKEIRDFFKQIVDSEHHLKKEISTKLDSSVREYVERKIKMIFLKKTFFFILKDEKEKAREKLNIDKIEEIFPEKISSSNLENEEKKLRKILNLLFFKDKNLEELRSFDNEGIEFIFDRIKCFDSIIEPTA